MARPFVSEIRERDRVVAFFLVTKKELRTTKNGAAYLVVTLADRTGDLEGRAWEDAEKLDLQFEKGSYVKVDALASAYNGRLQLKIDRLRAVAKGEVDPRDFLPVSRFDPEEMFREVLALVDGLGDELVRKLCRAFLDDPDIAQAFKRAPAAKGIHHAFASGLLEHTLSVMQLAHRIADHYPRASRDLLVAGALLHDIGKTRELSWEQGFDYTTEGRLVGHILLTIQWIHEKAAQIPNFPPELAMHLVHIVAAHHGELANGSPKEPLTLEAMIVHALDELDSRVQSWTMIFERDRNDEWTDFQRIYDRYLFKGPGWGREKAGLPTAEEGRAWRGESLYRREKSGEPVPRAVEAPKEEAQPLAGLESKRKEKREAKENEETQTFDLFARPRAG